MRTNDWIDLYKQLEVTIIPCNAESKRASVKWEPYQKEKPSKEKYKNWFPDDYKGNFAAVCGESSNHLFVMDLDELELEHKLFPGKKYQDLLNKTLVIETGTGKKHIYLRAPESFPRIQINNGEGKEVLSIRSQGAYVICPPSIHPDTKKPYKIISNVKTIYLMEKYQAFIDGIKTILKIPKETRSKTAKIKKGNRNNSLFKLAVNYSNNLLDKGTALKLIMEKNDLLCDPPLSDKDIHTIVDSAFSGRYNIEIENIKDIRAELLLKKEPQEKYNLLANYIIANSHIKSDNYTKDVMIYDKGEGIYKTNGEVIIKSIIDKIYPTISNQGKNEVLDKIKIRTPFSIYNFDKLDMIACKNGVIDKKTLEIIPFSSDYNLTRKINVEHNPEANSELLDQFLLDITSNNQDMIDSLMEVIADCLNNHYHSQKMHLFVGKGLNGKGTFCRLETAFLGKENVSSLNIFQINNRFMTAKLFGKLANIGGDISAKKINFTGILKNMRGEDLMTGDRKNKEPLEWYNTTKGQWCCQEIPTAEDVSNAWYRSWLIYNFDNQFEISDFEEQLITPETLSALLNKVLIASRRLEDNQWHFTWEKYTPTIEHQKARYDFASNNVKAFWNYACEYQLGSEIPKDEVYNHYINFCQSFNLVAKDESQFAKDLKFYATNIGSKRITIEGKRVYCWLNIKPVRPVQPVEPFVSICTDNKLTYDKRKRLDTLDTLDTLQKILDKMFYEVHDGPVPISEVINEAVKIGFDKKQVVDIINKFKLSGELFEPKHDYIQRVD